MARTGRPKFTQPCIRKDLSLPQNVVAEVELVLHDPIRGKPKYGGFSQLVTHLLRQWLKEAK